MGSARPHRGRYRTGTYFFGRFIVRQAHDSSGPSDTCGAAAPAHTRGAGGDRSRRRRVGSNSHAGPVAVAGARSRAVDLHHGIGLVVSAQATQHPQSGWPCATNLRRMLGSVSRYIPWQVRVGLATLVEHPTEAVRSLVIADAMGRVADLLGAGPALLATYLGREGAELGRKPFARSPHALHRRRDRPRGAGRR